MPDEPKCLYCEKIIVGDRWRKAIDLVTLEGKTIRILEIHYCSRCFRKWEDSDLEDSRGKSGND